MSKANGKTTTLLLFVDSVFPKTETNTLMLSLETNTWKDLKCDAGEGWRRSVGPIM
jgi:hypothetical protein